MVIASVRILARQKIGWSRASQWFTPGLGRLFFTRAQFEFDHGHTANTNAKSQSLRKNCGFEQTELFKGHVEVQGKLIDDFFLVWKNPIDFHEPFHDNRPDQ